MLNLFGGGLTLPKEGEREREREREREKERERERYIERKYLSSILGGVVSDGRFIPAVF